MVGYVCIMNYYREAAELCFDMEYAKGGFFY